MKILLIGIGPGSYDLDLSGCEAPSPLFPGTLLSSTDLDEIEEDYYERVRIKNHNQCIQYVNYLVQNKYHCSVESSGVRLVECNNVTELEKTLTNTAAPNCLIDIQRIQGTAKYARTLFSDISPENAITLPDYDATYIYSAIPYFPGADLDSYGFGLLSMNFDPTINPVRVGYVVYSSDTELHDLLPLFSGIKETALGRDSWDEILWVSEPEELYQLMAMAFGRQWVGNIECIYTQLSYEASEIYKDMVPGYKDGDKLFDLRSHTD